MDHKIRYCPQTGGRPRYAEAVVRFEPATEFVFENLSSLPPKFVAAVEAGVRENLQSPCKMTLVSGKMHPIDSTEVCFKIVGRMAAELYGTSV